MNKRVVYPNGNGISILIPVDCGLSVEEIAVKDVPKGLPFIIVDASDIPQDREFRDAWEADFSSPDGFGGEK